MILRNRLILAFAVILLLAVIPITMFTLRVAPFNALFLENKNFEHSLESATANAKSPKEKARAIDALREYRQLVAIGEPLRREFIRFSIILTGILFFVAMGIIFISVSRITKPLKELTGATKRIAQGDTSVQLKETGSMEFNILINSFNSMTRALQEAQHRLVLAERHSAWREMARMLAHEIKNPLTPIQLSIQRLREKYLKKSNDLPDVIDKTTQVISQEVNNFVHLVDKFSEFAHLPSPFPELVNINTIVKGAATLYANLPNVKFEENYDESIPEIMVDPGQIKQALSNIIKNAIEAHPVRKEPSNGAREKDCVIQVTTRVLLAGVEVLVADNGKGIAEEDIERMFHPYFTTKAEGSGLGLVITERIVTEHSGKISISSKEGVGTTVSIKLPI